MKKPATGFIALMSALVISAVALLLVLGGSLEGFYSRVNAINAEYKERSFALAQACVNQTLLTLANNPSYRGNATTTVSGVNGSCYTKAFVPTGSGINDTYTFQTRAYVGNAYSIASVTAKVLDLTVLGQSELENF